MSKADQLGAGRFGGSARPVSARRAAIGAATGVPTEGVAPPTRLPVARISPNPENPRTTLGDLTELAGSLREHGQKQAITVMNRDAYLKANPDREKDLDPDTTHVVVDGSSRLAAAREAGLTHLHVMVDDEQGSDGDAILESALVANIHRNDLDPLDEARALQRLLVIHGSQVKLAKRLRKSQGWVSQRLALLNLSPQLQAAVGSEPVELLRAVAKEPQERQEAALEELKAERLRKEADRKTAAAAAMASPPPVAPAAAAAGETDEEPERYEAEEPEDFDEQDEVGAAAPVTATDRLGLGPGEPEPAEEELAEFLDQDGRAESVERNQSVNSRAPRESTAPAAVRSTPAPETVPEPRSNRAPVADQDLADAGGSAGRRLPYDNGAFLAMHLIRKMSVTEFDRMLVILNKHQQERLESPSSTR
ncbi:ParB/RepB/Spo0J family partition protein [Streptomyces sp. NPDC006743]|uniref:ParB/RepB/Spo0J family partition protein n=1 Tax=Streptomyces sp. NPDC006743 TaxID=3154480 RepID=UPI0034567F6A